MSDASTEERTADLDPRVRRWSRLAATLALGGFSALVAWQITHRGPGAFGAGLAAGAIAFVAWAPLVLKDGVRLGLAAVVGMMAVVAACLGLAISAGGLDTASSAETVGTVVFTLWVMIPLGVAVALAVAVATRLFARRGS